MEHLPNAPRGETIDALLVLADTYQLACHYAREHGLGRPGGRWRYVDEARTVRGMRGPGRYVLVTLPGARLGPRQLAERAFALDYLRSHGFVSAA